MTAPIPPKALETIKTLLENGWQVAAQRAVDSHGDPFLRLEARHPDSLTALSATWHTRDTDGRAYKWRSAMYDGRTVPSLAKLTRIIQGEDT